MYPKPGFVVTTGTLLLGLWNCIWPFSTVYWTRVKSLTGQIGFPCDSHGRVYYEHAARIGPD